jgi:pSer/pThr/pTyr-binding forkhead associated (FHA) protein
MALAVDMAIDRTILIRKPLVFKKPVEAQAEAVDELPPVHLVVTGGATRAVGRTFRIDKPKFTIGRAESCDLSLLDKSWSRNHAEIEFLDGGFVLHDTGSANGVYVNGRRVAHEPLLFGSVIQIGLVTLMFSSASGTFGGAGQGPYAAANVVLDALNRSETLSGRVTTVLLEGRTVGTRAISLTSRLVEPWAPPNRTSPNGLNRE